MTVFVAFGSFDLEISCTDNCQGRLVGESGSKQFCMRQWVVVYS